MNDSLSIQTTNDTSWYAMRVFMNKVLFCRDIFNRYNDALRTGEEPGADIPDDLMGEAME